MKPSPVRKIVDWILGLSLIAVGVVAGFIPVLQGWPFILAGLAVLSSHSRLARSLLDRARHVGRRIRDGLKGRTRGGGGE